MAVVFRNEVQSVAGDVGDLGLWRREDRVEIPRPHLGADASALVRPLVDEVLHVDRVGQQPIRDIADVLYADLFFEELPDLSDVTHDLLRRAAGRLAARCNGFARLGGDGVVADALGVEEYVEEGVAYAIVAFEADIPAAHTERACLLGAGLTICGSHKELLDGRLRIGERGFAIGEVAECEAGTKRFVVFELAMVANGF